jgi:hypothetical protein
MILLGVDQWLSGTWELSGIPGAVIVGPGGQVISDAPVDINDVPITVGATVKFVGVVKSVRQGDAHFNDIEVLGTYPDNLTSRAIGLEDPNIVGNTVLGVLASSRTKQTRYFHPLQLVVGA